MMRRLSLGSRRKSRSERISRKNISGFSGQEYLFFSAAFAACARETVRRRDVNVTPQLVLCVSMRDTRMHGDVNSRLYVRSARAEREEEEEEEDEERQTTLEDINHPMATLSRAHISDTQYARLWMSIDVEIPHSYSQHARTDPRDSGIRFARSTGSMVHACACFARRTKNP